MFLKVNPEVVTAYTASINSAAQQLNDHLDGIRRIVYNDNLAADGAFRSAGIQKHAELHAAVTNLIGGYQAHSSAVNAHMNSTLDTDHSGATQISSYQA